MSLVSRSTNESSFISPTLIYSIPPSPTHPSTYSTMAPSKRVLSVATANDSGSDAPVDKKRARIERKEKAVGAALSGTRKVAAPRRRNEQVKVEANILEESPAVQEEIKERESMHPASQHHVYCVRPPAFYHENVGQTAGLFNCINVTEFYDLCYALRSVLKSLRFHQEVCQAHPPPHPPPTSPPQPNNSTVGPLFYIAQTYRPLSLVA